MAGAIFRCEVEFAGIKGTACQYRRSDGLRPEPGWIDVNLKDLKRIRIVPRKMPWRAVNGTEFDGGISIRTWKNFKSRATVTGDRPPIPQPAGGGVPHFGDLVFRTFKGLQGDQIDEIRYKDVYVDSTGIEEVTRGLANIKAHNSGIVRVPLSDIRRYYPRCGVFFGKINTRLKDGTLDPTNLNGSTTWTFEEVVDYLFSQLPGSPAVHPDSDFRGRAYDDPVLEGEGEPAYEHIERLLDSAGLKAQMLPDGNYTVSRRFSTVLSNGEIPDAVGSIRHIEEEHYERAAAAIVDRPPAVWALGPRIVRRESFPYVPVLQDLDGRYYRLEAVCQRWGYPIESLNKQVFAGSQTRFNDVPPVLGGPSDGGAPPPAGQQVTTDGNGNSFGEGGGDGPTAGSGPAGGDGGAIESGEELHFKRQELLKKAYRTYAPVFLLQADFFAPLLDPDSAPVRYLPIVKTAWYKSEIGSAGNVPVDDGGKGDLEDYVLAGPIARGQTVASRYMRNFEEFQKIFDARTAADKETLANLNATQEEWLRTLSEVAGAEQIAEKNSLKTLDAGKLAKYGVTLGPAELGADRSAAREMGELMPDTERLKALIETVESYGYVFIAGEAVKAVTDQIEKVGEKVGKWNEIFADMKEIYQSRMAIPCRYNTPQHVLPDGVASVDSRTGILTSSVPLAVVDKPFFFEGDAQTVVGDGAVVVTFGYELKGSEMECWTNFLFDAEIPDDPAEPAKARFCGSSRTSPIKAETVRMKTPMYQLENGNPVNYSECYAEARSKASAMLDQPSCVEGMTYELIGLRKAVLYAEVNSVQHEFDGSKGMTHVSVNAPGARGPLGAADLGLGGTRLRRGVGMTRAEFRDTLPPPEAQ